MTTRAPDQSAESIAARIAANTSGDAYESLLKGIRLSDRFREFVEKYDSKIASKIAKARGRDALEDVISELNVGYHLLQAPIDDLEYEPLGGTPAVGPDYLVRGPESFYVEAKRIRDVPLAKFDQAISDGFDQLVANTISPLRVSLAIDDTSALTLQYSDPQAVVDAIQAEVHALIKVHSLNPVPAEPVRLASVPSLYLTLDRAAHKAPGTATESTGPVASKHYNQREPHKFSDAVLDCLHQLGPDHANVLVVRIDSSIHEPEDLITAMATLNELVAGGQTEFFCKRGFATIADYKSTLNKLGVVVALPWWAKETHVVWRNENAVIPISERTFQLLRRL